MESLKKVYFAPFKAGVAKDDRLCAVLEKLDFAQSIDKEALTAIKLHFGELGNDTFVRPYFVRHVVDAVKAQGGKPFLTDSNTLYKYKRHNAVDHLETAIKHGFGYEVTGAPMIISDGLRGFDWREVEIEGDHFKRVLISPVILDSDAIVTISHFKGHPLAGFGGAIKNLAMGCAPALGKREQHANDVVVDESNCIACGACEYRCPVMAIKIKEKAYIDPKECMACGNCLEICPTHAINLTWETDSLTKFGHRIAEYALGAVKDKKRPLYINFLMDITPGCDCHNWSDPAIVPDIGIIGSDDPVALDKACYDIVNAKAYGCSCGTEACDKFLEIHPKLKPLEQLIHAAKLNLGQLEYKLEEI